MPAAETAPSFVIVTEAQKAAWDNGYRLARGIEGAWLRYGSTTARGDIWLAGGSDTGPWFLSVAHRGVAVELAGLPAASAGPGVATFELPTLKALHTTLDRVYHLAVSLPDAPLDRFRSEVGDLPRTTEAERLVVQRVGQDIFREALLDYWGRRCPMTGITEADLLRASHIVPWANCSDEQRLDVHNGLLLSALWDAAFDRGLIGFADDGTPLAGPRLGPTARAALAIDDAPKLVGLRDQHRANLAHHRRRYGFSEGSTR